MTFTEMLLLGHLAILVVSACTQVDECTSTRAQSLIQAQSLITKPCGFESDCPLKYSLAEVAKYQKASAAEVTAPLEEQHRKSRAACASVEILSDGGWCYNASLARPASSRTLPSGEVDQDAPSTYDEEFLIPKDHVGADSILVETLATKLLLKDDGSCCHSLTDFGAGVGQVGHALRARLPGLQYHGYDAAGNVEEFTHGYVKFGDLTQPLSFKRTDYVLSAEVGEHIPNKFEQQVIENIHAHNCKGVVLTWAVLGQGGHGHVNCHSNKYLINLFENLGYVYNDSIAEILREPRPTHYWFTNSAMVFDRVKKPEGC